MEHNDPFKNSKPEDSEAEMKQYLSNDLAYVLQRLGDEETHGFHAIAKRYEERQMRVLAKLSQLQSYLSAKEHLEELNRIQSDAASRIGGTEYKGDLLFKQMEIEQYKKIVDYFEKEERIPPTELRELRETVDSLQKTKDLLETLQKNLRGDASKSSLN